MVKKVCIKRGCHKSLSENATKYYGGLCASCYREKVPGCIICGELGRLDFLATHELKCTNCYQKQTKIEDVQISDETKLIQNMLLESIKSVSLPLSGPVQSSLSCTECKKSIDGPETLCTVCTNKNSTSLNIGQIGRKIADTGFSIVNSICSAVVGSPARTPETVQSTSSTLLPSSPSPPTPEGHPSKFSDIRSTRKQKINSDVRMESYCKYKDPITGLVCCYLCERDVGINDFDAGHIQSEANGGLATVDNLRPLHPNCNRKCGKRHLYEYKPIFDIYERCSCKSVLYQQNTEGFEITLRENSVVKTTSNVEEINAIFAKIANDADLKRIWINVYELHRWKKKVHIVCFDDRLYMG